MRGTSTGRSYLNQFTAVFVPGTNSGLFTAITFTANGDALIDLDPDQLPGPLLPQDTLKGQIEGAVAGTISIARISVTQLRVQTFNAAGVLAFADYSLNINTVNFG